MTDKKLEDLVEKSLVETTTGPNDPNVAMTDENLSIEGIFQQMQLPSLGRQIFSLVPIHGPTGALFNLQRNGTTNNIELVRGNVQIYPSTPIYTGITQEAIQDIRAQYGMSANSIIGKLLRGLANEAENTDTLAFLDANCLSTTTLQLSNSLNAETNLFELTQKIHELVLQANSNNRRTYGAFAVIPYVPAAGILGLKNWATGGAGDIDPARGLFVTQLGLTKIFFNPDAASTTAYVGLLDDNDMSKSAAVFSPYASSVVEAYNPDDGQPTYTIYNRYGITASPLHVTGNEMMFKFTVLV